MDWSGKRCGHNYSPTECPYARCGYREALAEVERLREEAKGEELTRLREENAALKERSDLACSEAEVAGYYGQDLDSAIACFRDRIAELTNERDGALYQLQLRVDQPEQIHQLTEALKPYQWRPISEIHEDCGPCVLINLLDGSDGYMEIGSVLDTDFNERDWTHFAECPKLSTEEANRLILDGGGKARE
jgi:hypothetical protein